MNITAPMRGFLPDEYEQRLQRAQRLLAAAHLSSLLLTSEADVRYFSGFLTQFWQSTARPWFLLVPQTGKPVAVIPSIGKPLMEATWLDDIRSWDSPNPVDEGVSLLADVLRDKGGTRVGIPMGAEAHLRMPLGDYARLRELLPAIEFIDSGDIMARLRMVKSPAEIAKITHSCSIAAKAFAAVTDFANSGMSLRELCREFKRELLAVGADDVPYLASAAAVGGYTDVIAPPTDTPLASGDVVMIDTGAVYDGYFCDFDRNFAVGCIAEETRRLYAVLHNVVDVGKAAALPGATCAAVFSAMRQVIADSGYDTGNVGRFGHGLGMQLTEWPSISAADQTVLRPGMVITLEPSAAVDERRGMVHEENIVIGEDGAVWLSKRAPTDLPLLV